MYKFLIFFLLTSCGLSNEEQKKEEISEKLVDVSSFYDNKNKDFGGRQICLNGVVYYAGVNSVSPKSPKFKPDSTVETCEEWGGKEITRRKLWE